MDYKERFRNILKRLNSDSNRECYNAICTLPKNDDEKRVWDICKKFWGKNEAPFGLIDVPDEVKEKMGHPKDRKKWVAMCKSLR